MKKETTTTMATIKYQSAADPPCSQFKNGYTQNPSLYQKHKDDFSFSYKQK